MRISISNIAWGTGDDSVVADLLVDHSIDAIDVAPSKYFNDFAKTSSKEISDIRYWWEKRGIEIVGMQALFFGTHGMNLFGEPFVRDQMLNHLGHVCRIAQQLGARFLVFGSPRNRDRSGLDDYSTMKIARDFFRRLGDLADDRDTIICLEPNPPVYGANFMMNATSTAEIVRDVDHPAIRMQLDVGALTINGESASEVLENNVDLIAHIHASEPNLKVLGECGTNHALVAAAIREHCPDRIVTVEMREDASTPIDSLGRALVFVKDWYE